MRARQQSRANKLTVMRSPDSGFTRFELLACLVAIALLGVITLPLVAGTKSDSARAVCANNLRQIGIALQRWGNDHDDHAPWITSLANGGTRFLPKTATPWFEFIALSNELSSPRLLVCPLDTETKIAENFTSGARGLANSGYRGNAIGYSLVYDSDFTRPQCVFVTDRDFQGSGPGGSCSIVGAGIYTVQANTGAAWTNELHRNFGHLLFAEGSVDAAGSARLGEALAAGDDAGALHYGPPR
jgi:hypothetical protein